MKCSCEVCEYGKEVQKQLNLLTEESKLFFEGMYDRLQEVENDLDIVNSILDGSWPNAEMHLEQALARIQNNA